MTARYANELARLDRVYEAAWAVDISDLRECIEQQFKLPLLTIGSGGSFSTASVAATLHQRYSGQLARAATPLEFLDTGEIDTAVMCFSASGRNRDIEAAFKAAVVRERGPVSALVMRDDTPIHALSEKYADARVAACEHKLFKDGFLAVATLLASTIVLVRSYMDLCGTTDRLPSDLVALQSEALQEYRFTDIPKRAQCALSKQTVSFLFSPGLKPVATDLESRFVEAALGNLHIADFRNFGHGRHYWMAKRGDETGVVALVSSGNRVLADRTLGLLPASLETCQLNLTGVADAQLVAGVIAGFYISLTAGTIRGIDPGKPGVPPFGRRLYGLGPRSPKLTPNEVNRRAAIRRKTRRLSAASLLERTKWEASYRDIHEHLSKTPVTGVVLDYDGTLCGDESRFSELPQVMTLALEQLLRLGLPLGIATGRGPSAGAAMRSSMSEDLWGAITIGYYNGAIITTLRDRHDPIILETEERLLVERLREHPEIANADIKSNEVQTTIRLTSDLSLASVIDHARAVLAAMDRKGTVCASSHSIDVVMGTSSKLDVVDAIRPSGAVGEILRIGDRGRWPGNDAALLDHAFGLSVDEVSDAADRCWNLAPAGIRGPQATRHYLSCLQKRGGRVFLEMKPSHRGVVKEG